MIKIMSYAEYHMKWYYLSYNSNSVGLTDLPYAFGFYLVVIQSKSSNMNPKGTSHFSVQHCERLRKRGIITLTSPISMGHVTWHMIGPISIYISYK